MDGKPIVADYSLDVPWGVESQRASIDKVLDEFMAYDEERERRRRERMLEAQRAMAATGHSSAPRGQNHLFAIHGDGTPVDDSQDDAIASGLSLAMGSEAHKVYVQNREGMDRFERERADMAAIGFGTKGDQEAPGADEYHDELMADRAQQDAETAAGNELQADKRRMATTERMHEHVLKHEQAERIIELARERAGSTETSVDDQFVSEALPKILESRVHDVAVRNLDRDVIATDHVMDKIEEMSEQLEA